MLRRRRASSRLAKAIGARSCTALDVRKEYVARVPSTSVSRLGAHGAGPRCCIWTASRNSWMNCDTCRDRAPHVPHHCAANGPHLGAMPSVLAQLNYQLRFVKFGFGRDPGPAAQDADVERS